MSLTVMLVAGAVLFGYGLRCLRTGRVISSWGQTAHRPSLLYWVTVGALLLLGAMNLAMGMRSF